MDQLMVESCGSATVEDAAACAPPHPPPPPPPTAHRRPRVREVSSRFMSPAVSTGDLPHPLPTKSPLPKHHQHAISTPSSTLAEIQSRQRSSSVNSRRRHLDLEPFRCSDENRPTGFSSIHTPSQSWEIRLPPEQMLNYTGRKQRPVKPFKENGGGKVQPQQQKQHLTKTCTGKGSNAFTTPSRPDTPMVTASLDRTSRFRLIQQRSTNITATAAAKLLQSSGMSLPAPPTNLVTETEANTQDATSAPQLDPSSPSSLPDVNNHSQMPVVPSWSTRCLPDIRSSMPEADLLPSVSSRQLVDESSSSRGNATVTVSDDFFKCSASPCSRSLNLPLSSSDILSFQPNKGSERLTSVLSKPYKNTGKMGGFCLPPVPPSTSAKLSSDTRRGKKVSGHLEDVHSLRVLHNRYLQWRYTNARAEASMRAQQRETERTLYSLAVKIAELYDSVKRKRIELGILQRTETLSAILDAQIPYLDQWFALQGDHSSSLAEATQALSNASFQLPISGNVRVDLQEVKEALNSAVEVMEIIDLQVQRSTAKAEETENLISELARVTGGERAVIEECGNMLSKTYTMQKILFRNYALLSGGRVELKGPDNPVETLLFLKSISSTKTEQ
ncbi:hypothetical protein ACE6H2_012748 [Prunus campanulata]